MRRLKDYSPGHRAAAGAARKTFTAKAQKWVDDLEGHYTDSPECGCVVPKIKFEVHNTMVREVPNGLPSGEASDLKFEVNLLPLGEDKPGGYQGDVSLVRTVQVTVPSNCKVGGNTINEHWTFYAILQPDSDSMQVWHFQVTDDPVGVRSGVWSGRQAVGATDVCRGRLTR